MDAVSKILSKQEPFAPEIKTRYKLTDQFVGKTITILEARYIQEYRTQFGRQDTVLLACRFTGNDKAGNAITQDFTTITSRVAIVEQVRRLIDANAFPARIVFVALESDAGKRYMALAAADHAVETDDPESAPEPVADLPF